MILGRDSTQAELEYLQSAQSRWVKSVGREPKANKVEDGVDEEVPAAVETLAAPAQKPMRILVLHGFRQVGPHHPTIAVFNLNIQRKFSERPRHASCYQEVSYDA